ncbi:hypothetical protein V8F33_008219 [Rhypophila sp. PSN 637]
MEPFVYLPEYPFVILGEIPGIIPNQAGLYGFSYPPATTEPIPFIAAPEVDGIRCDKCGFTTYTIRGIQGHYREEHGWENDWKKGGNVAKRARQDRRFFRSCMASQWFEVGRGNQVAVVAVASASEETIEQRITQIHKAQANKFEEKKQQIIQAGDEKAEPNPWLRRVGWAEHLKGLDKERLRESMGPIAVPIRVGHTVLFEVNRKEAHIKARKPFDSRIEDDTWVRYREVMRKLLCFIQRTKDWEDEARPPYTVTEKQGSLYDGSEDTGNPSVPENLQVVDRLYLDTIVLFLDYWYKHSYYEGAIISGGWENVDNYTPIYSVVIKMARMLVQDEILELRQTMSKEEAEETVTGLFTIVRKKVWRFLIVVSDKIEPRPIDWIFDRIRFNMHELLDMLYGLVQEVRAVMGRLLMVEKDDFRSIPRIEWTKIEDDHSEDSIGYSFLQDDRNPWVSAGNRWVLKQMFRSEER